MTQTIRIRYTDWKKLRQMFPSFREETTSSYLQRLVQYLDKRYFDTTDKILKEQKK
mgnify:CR=1 FL=1